MQRIAIAFVLLVYPTHPAAAQATRKVAAVRIPFISCPSDGQLGHVAPIRVISKVVHLAPEIAWELAWYQGRHGPGVLAPRGWQCFATYGSSGAAIYVTPHQLTSQQLFAADWKGINGMAVQLSERFGGTSGRFAVAEMISRVFPAYQAFAKAVEDEGSWPYKVPRGPFPADSLRYENEHAVEYLTPPRQEGLGTQSRLVANDLPIAGVVLLTGADTDLISLSIRLPVGTDALVHGIIQQAEQGNTVAPPKP